MLNILLVILKTAGILVAVLLCLILISLLAVLLVPVRYSISGEYGEKSRPKADVNVSWMLRLLRAHIGYDGALSYEIRIFGRCIESSEGTKAEPPESPEPVKAESSKQKADGNEPEAAETGTLGTDRAETDYKSDEDKTEVDETETDRFEADKSEVDKPEPKPHMTAESRPAQGRVRRALSRLPDRIKHLVIRLAGFIRKLRENKDGVTAFFADSGNKRAMTLLWSSTRKILSHIWPRVLDGHLTFGFDDPAVTGYTLAVLSMMPEGDGTDMSVTPVFDRRYLDCAGRLRGRVRLAVAAGVILKIYFDNDCRKLYSEVANGGK